MSAFLIVQLKFHDLAWSKEYLAKVPAMLRSLGGEYLARSRTIERFEVPAATPVHIAILTFPLLDAIRGFMASSDYAPFRAVRIAATDSDILAFAE